jgi:sugar transferase (PEP-CTERM/EpsH1 system associated)
MPKPIRIMHIVDSLGKGGLENGLVNLIQRMDARQFQHVVYTVRSLGPNAARIPHDRVQVVCLAKKQTDSSFHVPALAHAIREVKPDIVHSRNWAAIEAVIAGRWVRSCALVHSEHGFQSDANATEPRRRTWFRRLAFELADRVLSVSYQLREVLARRTGFPKDRITVIHNGVDHQRFLPDPAGRARVRAELGLSADEFCVGCVGNLFPVKDHMTLLRAAAGLAEACQKWRLLVIGEGPELANLQEFVNAHAAWKTKIAFLGLSDRVPELLRAMDVYVLPSINEGISNGLLEAMATGLPVVATATGGNPEVVVDGESGMLFPVGHFQQLSEQLLLLRARKEVSARLGQKALARVRQDFSIDSMVRKYELLYESLAPGGGASRAGVRRFENSGDAPMDRFADMSKRVSEALNRAPVGMS